MIGSSSCTAGQQQPSGLQICIQQTSESVSETITKRRHKQTLQRARNLECNRSGERCNYSDGMQSRRCVCAMHSSWYTCLGHEEIGVGLLMGLLALLLLVGLRFVRRYNHTFAYGKGGCLSTVLWTYNSCEIIT